MYKINFRVHNYASINIYTDFDYALKLILNESHKILKTIPITNCEVSSISINDIDYNNALFIKKNNIKMLSYDKNKNVTLMNIDENIRLFDITYILLEMFENSLSKNNKYLVHSSSLKYSNDKSILLLGDANAGKSSLAYSLMQDYNMKLISNDHTLVGFENDKLCAYAGTKLLEMRNGVILEKFPRLLSKIDIKKDENMWKRKTIINKYIDNSLISNNDFSHITDVFQISLTNGGDSFIQTKDNYDQRLILYQRICDELKGNYNLILGFDYPMPSLESFEILNYINNSIKVALNETQVHIASGPVKELTRIMVKKLEK